MHAIILTFVCVCATLMQPSRELFSAEGDPLAREPYLGLSVRDSEHGPIVGWLSPGPLGGTGYESRVGLRRGDNLMTVNGVFVESAAEFNRIVASLAPGGMVHLQARRSPEATSTSAVPRGGPGGEAMMYTAIVSDRLTWSGTVGRGDGGRSFGPAVQGEFEAMIVDDAAAAGVLDAEGGLNPLLQHLKEVQKRAIDPNSLPAVVKAFERPLSLDAVEAEIADLVMAGFEGDMAAGGAWPWTLVAGVLDLPEIAGEGFSDPERPEALARVQQASAKWGMEARELARTMRRGVNLTDRTDLALALIRESPKLVAEVLPALATEGRARWGELDAMAGRFEGAASMAEVPEAVRAAVEGDILHAEEREGPGGGWLVVGGPGANTYDMSKIAMVIDMGGDDVYRYGASRAEHLVQVVIDLGGDDVHESLADFAGPATAVFGVSVLDSRGGNDVFRSGGDAAEKGTHFTVGAGLFGLGILVNRAGDDQYLNTGPNSGWSTGVGFYGAGLVIDLAGADTYHAEKLSQGVGGPRGVGMIIDGAGDDSYKANGPNFKSVYGTEGVYVSMSQGFGYGVRSYAAGGVGAIYDLEGNDRYEAGEFAQAGGYYFGLGIIRDRRGNDVYRGNRYGQAFAAHQAAGILIDDEGDDQYWSMTAASQSGAWDQSITMLIDRAGNDVYEADGLAQGAAAMQAIALLIDMGGDDRYAAKGGSVQGAGGNNTYHHQTAGVFSFSGLFDLGGGEDEYSSGRGNNTREATGQKREDVPAESTVYGVFVDR
jgi:hypothetical protein